MDKRVALGWLASVCLACGPLEFAPEGFDDQGEPVLDDAGVSSEETLTNDCKNSSLSLTWPLSVVGAPDRNTIHGHDYVINNYVDLDATTGTRDYMGNTGAAAVTYDGHGGYDIDIPTFREMDNDTALVRAAAPGRVELAVGTNYDRNTSCTGEANAVWIKHDNGFTSIYAHLKQGSLRVTNGQTVTTGTVLGVVGSSGCSSQPHLHFEVRNCSWQPVEPASFGMWTNLPSYTQPSDVMDFILKVGSQPSFDEMKVKNRAPNATTMTATQSLGLGLSAGARNGDQIQILVWDPYNSSFGATQTRTISASRYAHRYEAFTLNFGNTPGTWTIWAKVGPGPWRNAKINVKLGEIVYQNIPAAYYQSYFNTATSQGFKPKVVDGFDVGGQLYYNAIFVPNDGYSWVARHGLDGTQFQNEINYWKYYGYRLSFLDSYRCGGTICYAAIFEYRPGAAWAAYFGRSAADHQAIFNGYVAQGFRPLNISVVNVGGVDYFAALYDTTWGGYWSARAGLRRGEFASWLSHETAHGSTLIYLDVSTDAYGPRFSAIWNTVGKGGIAQYYDLSASSASSFRNTHTVRESLNTRILTGYDGGGGIPLFATFFSEF